MSTSLSIKYLLSALLVLLLKLSDAQTDCPDLLLLNPVVQYNNPTLYPAGSLLYDFGNVKIYNFNASDHATEPTILDSITDEPLVDFPYSLYFKGKITFDFSAYPSDCKWVRFAILGDSILVDGNPYKWTGSASLPHWIGDSIRIEDAGGGLGLAAVGKFSTITFTQDPLAPYARLDGLCIEDCPDTSNCSIDFDFVVNDSIVDFTNLSSLNPTNADFFEWSLINPDVSSEENPTYKITENGDHNICLSIMQSSCLFGKTTLNKCLSVPIEIDYNLFDDDNHFMLSPNNDGIQDYLPLKAGSKIFNRNGYLLVEVLEDIQWEGKDANNLLLPTGLYTILYNQSKLLVTVVR